MLVFFKHKKINKHFYGLVINVYIYVFIFWELLIKIAGKFLQRNALLNLVKLN